MIAIRITKSIQIWYQ